MPAERVLVVDDDLSMREFLSILLQRDGFVVDIAPSGEAALSACERAWPDLVLTDLTMPGISGIELLRELKERAARAERDIEVVMVTAYGTTGSAVDAMKQGAADYVLKPFNNEELRMIVRRVLNRRRLEVENARLKVALHDRFGNLVGHSPGMAQVFALVDRVKDSRINCLLLGESGTGKEMVARAIHFGGARAERPFVPINCGAIPETLVESELFGYRKGAFTGANRDKQGLLEAAHTGTLFLDEVNSLPQAAQVKLLRALQERRITPVGATRELEIDVRILAASNAPLEDLVADGQFRDDLFYRLNVVQITLPPLRERAEDIPDLVRHFLVRYAEEYGKPVKGVAPDAMELLRNWGWPGNVRELQNTIERAVALCGGERVRAADLPPKMAQATTPPAETAPEEGAIPAEGVDLDAMLGAFEKRWLLAALAAAEGNKTRAASLLRMSFRSFRYRLAKFGLDQV